MIKFGKVYLKPIMKLVKPFGNACVRYHDNILDDEAKAEIAKYRELLLAYGIDEKYVDNYERYLKRTVTGVIELDKDEGYRVKGRLVGAVVAKIGRKLHDEGADIILTVTEEEEALVEGKTDEELRVIVEDMYGPIEIPKK